MAIYDYGDDGKQRIEVTTEYICSKLENMNDAEDGMWIKSIKRCRDEVVNLSNNLKALGYTTSLKEDENWIDLTIWKYKNTDLI